MISVKSNDVRSINSALERVMREVRRARTTSFSTTAPIDPSAGDTYWSSDGGKIYVFHPNGWETYSKDT